jgi:hypothetical protein
VQMANLELPELQNVANGTHRKADGKRLFRWAVFVSDCHILPSAIYRQYVLSVEILARPDLE